MEERPSSSPSAQDLKRTRKDLLDIVARSTPRPAGVPGYPTWPAFEATFSMAVRW
jgi:hypothetical protein